MRSTVSVVPLAAALLAGAVTVSVAASARAQSDVPPELASVDWPPAGESLRTLARRHDFDIGFAARQFWPSLPEAGIYGEIARTEFGTLTPEGSLKWLFLRPFEDVFDFDDQNDVDALIDFAEDNGMRVHGHPLAWYRLNPPWLDDVAPERMEAVLREHVETVVSRYAGRVDVWDVVNEGLDDEGRGFRAEDPFYAAIGPAWLDVAFETARAADPDAALIYNDYAIGWLTDKSSLALGMVDDLLERGVPIDGIGMQMHLDHTFPHFEGFSEAMQRFADRGLDVYVTELDVSILSSEDLGVQAEVFEEIVRRCLMQPRCRALQTWGISDVYSFIPQFRPLAFDADFRAKPAYFGMRRALATRPVHPERCALDGARVESGAIYADGVDDGAGTGGAGDAFAARCEGVRLEGGFTTLTVRYRNPGTDTPTLDVRAGETLLASVPLAPTAGSIDGDSRTVTVPVAPLDATLALELAVASVSDGACVGVDALLFGDPTLPLPPPELFDEAASAGSGGGGGKPLVPNISPDEGGARDCVPDERPDGPLDTRPGVEPAAEPEPVGGGGGGEAGEGGEGPVAAPPPVAPATDDDGGFLGASGVAGIASLALVVVIRVARRCRRGRRRGIGSR